MYDRISKFSALHGGQICLQHELAPQSGFTVGVASAVPSCLSRGKADPNIRPRSLSSVTCTPRLDTSTSRPPRVEEAIVASFLQQVRTSKMGSRKWLRIASVT